MISPQEVNILTLQDDVYYFIKLPANPTLSFLSVLESIPSNNTLKDLSHNSDFSQVPRERIGIYILHPAARLWHAYNNYCLTIDQKVSFQEYYSQPVRRNFYTQYFKDNKFSNLGFVGFGEHPIKSFVLAHHWLKLPMGRVAYSKLDVLFKQNKDSELSYINQQDLDKIKTLHAEDINLYESLMESFQLKWLDLTNNNKINLPINKKVFIHLGPPKTGTSAIQYWLKSHSKDLAKEGILYPEHSLDSNRISSGNVDQIISVNKKTGNAYFDHKNASQLISKFGKSKFDLMLLSSEHFYYYLIWLFISFPNATFIFYIRHPIASLQSSYNQEVKRHKRTSTFVLPKTVKFSNLYFIYQIAREFDIRFEIRFFDKNLFVDNSLISDFLSCLPKSLLFDGNGKDVNSQYCFEAMEFMRKVNAFGSDETLKKLDLFLQNYSVNKPKFSLINSEQAQAHNQKLLKDTLDVVNFFSIPKKQIQELIENFTVNDELFNSQELEVEFDGIIKSLKKNDLKLLGRIEQELKDSNLDDMNLDSSIFEISQIQKFWHNLKNATSKRLKKN